MSPTTPPLCQWKKRERLSGLDCIVKVDENAIGPLIRRVFAAKLGDSKPRN